MSITVIKNSLTRINLGEEGAYLSYNFKLWPIIAGQSSPEFKVSCPQSRAERDKCTHAACLLSSIILLSCFVQEAFLGSVSAHNGLILDPSINPSQICPQTNQIKTITIQLRLSSLVILSCDKLTFKTNHHSSSEEWREMNVVVFFLYPKTFTGISTNVYIFFLYLCVSLEFCYLWCKSAVLFHVHINLDV